MSELIQKQDNRATIRWKLLTGASALALTAYISSAGLARAEDSGQPQIWIELGGNLSRLQDSQEIFAPPIMDARPAIFHSAQDLSQPPKYGFDEEGKITLQPEGSDWIFSAAMRYGRAVTKRDVTQGTYPTLQAGHFTFFGSNITPYIYAHQFADTQTRINEKHAIIDFQAGKDVGLGMFGHGSESSVSLGVRIAQFSSKTNIAIKSNPDFAFVPATYYGYNLLNQRFHSNIAELTASRSFRGIGPSLSWQASAPMAGNTQAGEISLDWGLNASLLFGRQHTRTHHQTTGRYHPIFHTQGYHPITYQGPATPDHVRSRSITVPNVGGFAGVSYRYSDAKISFGYRADFFFGAIDGGIDAAKKENRGFFGPYASISIGLGD